MGERIRIKVQDKLIDIPAPHDQWGRQTPAWVAQGYHDLINDILESGSHEDKVIKGLWETGQVVIYPSDLIEKAKEKPLIAKTGQK